MSKRGASNPSRGRGGAASRGRGGKTNMASNEFKKETIFDYTKYENKAIRLKFHGGREVYGILKGYDPFLNLVLDETKEYLRDPADPLKLLDETRDLGLVVCRGTQIILVSPVEGSKEIDNPFQ